MEPVSLNIPDHLSILDLDVRLNITHTEVSDLAITLESPTGQIVKLKNQWSPPWHPAKRAHMHNTIFDDQADSDLLSGLPPYTGRFNCDDGKLLSAFNGSDAFGLWTLYIDDHIYLDFGALNYFELTIEAVETPEPFSLLYLAAAALLLRIRRRA